MIEREDLLSLVPHRGRMLLLSRIINCDTEERSIEAEYDITTDCIFYDSAVDGVPTWAGFEFIAQTIAAFLGLRDKEKGAPPKIGFVLAVSGMKMEIPFFKAGTTVTIKSKEIEEMHPVYAFEGEIFLNGEKVLGGKLTVKEADDEDAKRLG